MKKIIQFLKKLFAKSKWLVEQYVRPSVEVVENIKAFVDSPAVPILTAIIPGTVDDVIASKIKIYLPKVLQVLGYAECINAKTGDAVLQCFVSNFRLYNPEQRHAAAHVIAAKLAEYIADGKLSWTELIHLTEITHNELKK